MLRLVQAQNFLKQSNVAFWSRRYKARRVISQTRVKWRLHEVQHSVSLSTVNSASGRSSPKLKWFWMPAGVGFALISFIQLRHIQQRERRKHGPSDTGAPHPLAPPWPVAVFKVIPTRVLSRLWGKVNDIELPMFLRRPLIGLWVWAFDCNLVEAEDENVQSYANLGAFFTRKLKPGARAIDHESELVCPVDGKVLHFGPVIDGKLEQVKGVPYSLETFIGPPSLFPHPAGNYMQTTTTTHQLYHCVLYLGPGDCHHFHSPTEWSITARRHFPGKLNSVSPWVLKGFKDILCTNERVTLLGEWKHGLFTMSAVGAYNVGSITIHVDENLNTNTPKGEKTTFNEKLFSKQQQKLTRGDNLGLFSMGSAIVLVFEAPKEFQFCIEPNQKIYLGQPLGTVAKN